MTTEESLITPEARALIGRENEPVAGHPVTEHEIRRFCCAVDDLNPLYLDPNYAAKTKYGGIIAPPMFLSIPFARYWSLDELAEDGLPQAAPGARPPLKVQRAIAAGGEIEFAQPIRLGDVLTSRSKLVDLIERHGRLGRMVFAVTETTYTNQRGELVATDRFTLIYF